MSRSRKSADAKRRVGGRRRRLPKRFVFVTRDPASGKRVAVKRYRHRIGAIRERNAMRSYPPCPQLVEYYRYYSRKGTGYVVMEWVRGITLQRAIRRYGPFELKKTLDIALEILAGLDALHRSGYIHGDLHSKNVIVTDMETPTVKIIDFQHAVAKNENGKARARRRLHRPPLMLTPETRRRTIDDRYDIYGVGYMCACMLLGREPQRRIRMRGNTENPKTDRDKMWSVIRKAMHPIAARRFQSAREMIDALHAIRREMGHPVR